MTKNIVNIRIPLPADTGLNGEVLWAKPLGGGRYRISSIPFHAYNLNLGDIVYASVSAGDCRPVYRLTEVGSGNQTMRVFFPVALDIKERHAFVVQMKQLAASIEWADGQLCALSLSTPVVFDAVFDALAKLEVSGVLGFETTEWLDHGTR